MKMEDPNASSHWCHMCSQMINPITEMETIKCPICQSGFIEEMSSSATPLDDAPLDFGHGDGTDSDRALSLWAPILLGMISSPRHRHMARHSEFVTEDDMEVDHQLESLLRRRRRNSATILRLLQDIRAGIGADSENHEAGDEEGMILINPFNQTIILHGSSQNQAGPLTSLGDYFMGPGLDLLLQHLSENDPNRYGTPPAQKEAVEALPNVKIVENNMQCSVCLDECEIGSEVKEMPCGHKFHGGCILPWLELHSSCPVCRYQLPSDESKTEQNQNTSSNEENGNERRNGGSSRDERNDNNGRRISVPLPWPFNSLFSGSQSSSGSGSATDDPPSAE